jgi:hypothetical protein
VYLDDTSNLARVCRTAERERELAGLRGLLAERDKSLERAQGEVDRLQAENVKVRARCDGELAALQGECTRLEVELAVKEQHQQRMARAIRLALEPSTGHAEDSSTL